MAEGRVKEKTFSKEDKMKSWTKKQETRKEITKILDELNWKLLKFYADAYAKYIPINGMTSDLDRIANSIYDAIGNELSPIYEKYGLGEFNYSEHPFHDCDFYYDTNPTASFRRHLYYTLCHKFDVKEKEELQKAIEPKVEFFWSNLDNAKDCWIWKQYVNGGGYYQKVSKDEMVNYFYETKDEDILKANINVDAWGSLEIQINNDYIVNGSQF